MRRTIGLPLLDEVRKPVLCATAVPVLIRNQAGDVALEGWTPV